MTILHSNASLLALGTKIRLARKRKEWRLVDLADKLGVTPSTVCKWENGRARPKKIHHVAAVLGVEVEWLDTSTPDTLGDLGTKRVTARVKALSSWSGLTEAEVVDKALDAFAVCWGAS